jgi:diacylglycerol kinase family enzyme
MLAWLPAAWSTLRRYPVMAVRLTADNHESVRRTAIVFIGNNRYTLEGPGIGSRSGLEDGTLHVSIMRRCGVWVMLRLFTYALLGKAATDPRVSIPCRAKNCGFDSRRKQLAVALDGEVTRLRPPLHYRIHPASLTVMVPHA